MDMGPNELLASMIYNLAIKHNRSLPHVLATTAATLAEATDNLNAACNESNEQVFQVAS